MRHHAVLLALVLALGGGCTAAQQETPKKGPQEKKPESRPVTTTRPTIVRHDAKVGGVAIKVEMAADDAARKQGLMGRKSLPADCGMLFLYPEPRMISYWMKGCVISLDIAFVDASGKILSVETHHPPKPGTDDIDLPRATSPSAATMVLEMTAGWFKKNKKGVGDRLVLSAAARKIKAR